jgi:hypothetical protein
MEKLITRLSENGERVYVPKEYLELLAENEHKDTPVRDDRLDLVWDSESNFGILEPKEGYEPIIVIDYLTQTHGIANPIVLIYTYGGEIRVTGLYCDGHADTYINKII